jgi:TRAP-type C4-dicarboxylate transport system permease small subunit
MSEQIDTEGGIDRRPLPYLGTIDRIAEIAALSAFATMMGATLLQVAARYLHLALDWTEELARILFLASMMIGIALATRRREHIVVDFLFAAISRRAQIALSILFDIAILVLLAVWIRGALRLMALNAGATFVTVPWLTVSALYAVEAFGIALMMLFVAADLVRQGQMVGQRTRRGGTP